MHTTEWTETQVLDAVTNELQNGLAIAWQGRRYGPLDVWQSLVGAAAQTISLSQDPHYAGRPAWQYGAAYLAPATLVGPGDYGTGW